MIKIGIDIGATKTVIAYLDENGNLSAFLKVPSEKMLTEKRDAVDSLKFFIDDYIQNNHLDKKEIKGIGIGVPAVLDSMTQQIVSCPNLPGLDNLPLSKLLSPKINLPILVENDVNLIAVGEHTYGRGKGFDDLACIFVGTGLGCGLILRGQLYTGADGAAAEFGHTIYDPDGRVCGCGGQGCVEMYCSGKALTLEAKENLEELEIKPTESEIFEGRFTLAEKVIKSAHAGNIKARNILDRSFYILGLAITNLVNILNPRLIILGGGIITGWPEAIKIVRETVYKRARTVNRDRLVIDFPLLGEKAGLYGAVQLVEMTVK